MQRMMPPRVAPALASNIAALLSTFGPTVIAIGHQVDKVRNSLWFNWQCQPGGIRLAAGESERIGRKFCSGHSALLELINQLELNPDSAELDRQVLRVLDLSHAHLHPSRSYGDAIQLLAYRLGGVPSAMDWSVRTHRDVRSGRVAALVACRQAAVGGSGTKWSRCIVGYGADEALAITAAVLLREMVL